MTLRVKDVCFSLLQEIFYSRKNFERPDLQMKPHRSFEQEVALLDRIFADGAAYCMGTLNRQESVKAVICVLPVFII